MFTPSHPRSWYCGDCHTVVPVFLNRTKTAIEAPGEGLEGVIVNPLTTHCALSPLGFGVEVGVAVVVVVRVGEVVGVCVWVGSVDPEGSRVGVAREYE